jgi:ribonucleoside-diphosphate reductase alpha chain
MIDPIFKENNERIKFDTMLNKATKGLRVDYRELVNYIESLENNNISPLNLKKLLITQALKLTNINNYNNLDWRFVASRLVLFGLFEEASKTRSYNNQMGYSNSYYDFLNDAVNNHLYDDKILKSYSKAEIDEISKEINPEYDFAFDYAGMNLLSSRYLIKSHAKTYELPQEMFLSIALLLALPEKTEKRLDVAKKFYHAIASRKISLATPIVLNLRKPKGNLSSCFIGAMDDSLDSIYYTLDQLAQISKNAGGCGVNISRVRGSGSYIRGVKGASSGVMPWVKLINDTGTAVNQQGARAGAITVALDIWHLDIEDFLNCQAENGDLRKKAFDIFPQIVIPNLFMERVENNQSWHLFDPNEVKLKFGIDLAVLYGDEFNREYIYLEEQSLDFKKEISAKELFKTFLKIVVETGMPYVTFKDAINETNPNKHAGMIGNANLCTESFSNFRPSIVTKKELTDSETITKEIKAGELHTCNLVSLNLSVVDDSEIEELTHYCVRILDNTIEISSAPVPEANKHNNEYRILGVGSMGLADWLAKRKLTYSNSSKQVSELYERIGYAGVKASIDLAQERGAYPKYQGSDWSKGIVFGKDKEWFNSNDTFLGKDKWNDLLELLKESGIRNGGIFAIAPNTSTSLLMGSTASILPVFSKFFIDKASNGSVPVCPPFLSSDTFWYYQENKNIDQQIIIETVSQIQKWTDQGISMELYLNLNNGIRAKDIYNLYMSAWKKKCKTVYYVRSIALKANDESCVSCAN